MACAAALLPSARNPTDMSTPMYIITEHEGKLLLADEQFTRFWKSDEIVDAPVRLPADVIGVALHAREPYFQYTDRSEPGRQDMVLVSIPSAHGSLRDHSPVGAFPDQLRSASLRYPAYAMLDRDATHLDWSEH